MGAVIAYRQLVEVAQEARPYPTYLLEGAESGLCLFSAAFMGHNEAIHFALEGVSTTCVDIDKDKLDAMSALYQGYDFKFVCADAWEFAGESVQDGSKWDVVSVDTFRGNATVRSLKTLDLWAAIANKAVVATLEEGQTYNAPVGWLSHTFRRNSEVLWLVLTRA